MATSSYGLEREKLIEAIHQLSRLIEMQRSLFPKIGEYTSTLCRFLEGSHDLLDDITRGGIVTAKGVLGKRIFLIPESTRLIAGFYKNTIMHLFVPVSAMAVLHLLKRSINSEAVCEILELCGYTALMPDREEASKELTLLITKLHEENVLTTEEDRCLFANPDEGTFNPALLLGPIESLLWTEHQLSLERGELSSTKRIRYSHFLRKLQSEFSAGIALGLISRSEVVSKSTLEWSIDYLRASGSLTIEYRGTEKLIVISLQQTCRKEERLFVCQTIQAWLRGSGVGGE